MKNADGSPKDPPTALTVIEAVRAMTQVGARRAKLQRLDHAEINDGDAPKGARPAFFGQGILPRE